MEKNKSHTDNRPRAHGRGVLRNAALNAALLLGSIVLFLAFCEGVLFRFLLLPSGAPPNVYVDGLVRLQPGSMGVWRVGDDVAGRFRVNAQGWNSGHASYARTPPPEGVERIAIIGDSFVEALQVDYDASLAELLERAGAGRIQVYRFGVSGAPLSQYLLMARQVARLYRPDVIVLVLVHNDFIESYANVPGRYTSSFLKFRMKEGEVAEEIAPVPYQAGWRDWLRQTATLRYLYYRRKLTPETVLAQLPAVSGQPSGAPAYQANVALSPLLAERENITGATRYALGQFRRLAEEYRFRPLVIMDGDRRAIEAEMDSAPLYREGALWLNAMAKEAAQAEGITFIDLQAAFEADWRAHHQPLSFVSDNHWNARGHAIAAQALEDYLAENPLSP
jgi:hypothetical protein